MYKRIERFAWDAAVVLSFYAYIALNMIPFIGGIKGFMEGVEGHDSVTGRKLAWWERAVGIVAGALETVQFNSLGLYYPDSAYQPITDECVGVIRFQTYNVSNIEVPYGQAMGGSVQGAPPFLGNGFTASMNEQVIPEFIVSHDSLLLKDGAELYMITKEGMERLIATYSDSIGRFIDISK